MRVCVLVHDAADSITAANEANTAKEKALAEASALKLAAEREHAAFEEEWRQLTHLIEDDRCALECVGQAQLDQPVCDSSSAAASCTCKRAQVLKIWQQRSCLRAWRGLMQWDRVCRVRLICCCRRQREVTRQNEMAERERQTQELLKSCEVSVVDGISMAVGGLPTQWVLHAELLVHSASWLLCDAAAHF
jgi:hypothetical protein